MENGIQKRKGIVLAGGAGSRLCPLTVAVSKQVLPVYDKPMIYYPISVLLLTDIRDILIISTSDGLSCIKKILGTGEHLGVHFSYAEQRRPEGLAQAFLIGEEFLNGSPSVLILGDNIFYADHLTQTLLSISQKTEIASIFAYHVQNPSDYGVIEFDANGRALSLEEKPKNPRSSYAIPGLYFYPTSVVKHARTLKPSARGELEITDLNRIYLELGELWVESLGRGTAWFDTGTHNSLLEAANFVAAIQNRQGLQIGCLEEIAFLKKWIDAGQLERNIATLGKSTYSDYLKLLLETMMKSSNKSNLRKQIHK
jgi:glucose-1-phosphate thymidylyltransferase